MRVLAISFFILFAVQLPEQPVAAQTSQAEIQRLIRSAQSGDARAQFNLGLYYHDGRGVTQNYAEALKWYRRAAIFFGSDLRSLQ